MHNFDVNSANSADGYDNSNTVAVADADAAAVANASVFWAVTPTNSVMSAQAHKKCIKQLPAQQTSEKHSLCAPRLFGLCRPVGVYIIEARRRCLARPCQARTF